MKLSLMVMTPGKSEGKAIPITQPQFLIGRDRQCHLRPVSAAISKRHCALLVRGENAFVQDFDSTNGTFVNDEPVKGEREIHEGDVLKVGPLVFKVVLEAAVPLTKPTPAPVPQKAAVSEEDENIAAMLLALKDEESASSVDSDGVPTGSTVMDIVTSATESTREDSPAAKPDDKQDDKDKKKAAAASANTSSAAKAILEKYMRRPRT
jgi:pSer/pThr/pTyr-binding forkhead associated (FHA) protein